MKSKIKKVSIWLLCTVMLGVLSLLPSLLVSAADNKVSAYDQLIASAMSQCMDQLYATATDDFNNQHNPFAVIDFASVTVGYDLHNKLYGNTGSGSISCRDFNVDTFRSSIIEAFATSINPNYTTDNIVCDGENPGLMKLQWKDSSGNWQNMDGACASYLDKADGFTYRFVLNNRTDADSYLDDLYAGDWKSVSNFSDEAKYALYLDEYVAACTTGNSITSSSYDKATAESLSQTNLSGYSDYIMKINSNGNAEYVYYEQGNKATAWFDKSLSGGLAAAWLSGGKHSDVESISSCDDLRKEINGLGSTLHEEYETQLANQIKADKEMCDKKAKAALTASKQLVKDGYEGYDKTVAELEAMNGEYWTMEGNVVHCKTWNVPDKLVHIETETEKNDPNNVSDITSGADSSSSNLEDLNTSHDDDDIKLCKKKTSLGWIICPALHLVKSALDMFYGSLESDWLPIDGSDISDTSAIYDGWKEFRNYANVGFAIIFAIVLFSQITGIGLSNYGIKKLLPTLIVVAVLVNISFLICQLAVDITNIIGEGLGAALVSLGDKIVSGADLSLTGWDVAKNVTGTVFAAAGIGAAAGAVAVGLIGPATIISVLIAGVGSLIGYFVLLILLAVRKAIIFVLIILSPLAFVCYAFPNTKSIFEKWKKIFISLLLVFPICQVLVYGGQMVSKLMLVSDTDGFFYNLVALLLQVVPVFFIPMVLKSAMSMLGNIGAQISRAGANFRKDFTGRMAGSETAMRAKTALNNWGASHGPLGWTRKAIGNSSKFKNGKIGGFLNSYTARRSAEAKKAYKDLRLGDAEANYVAENTTEETIQNDVNRQAFELQQKAIGSALSTINRGDMEIDGKMVDPNDVGSVQAAHDYAQSQYVRTGDNQWRTRTLALQSKLMGLGKPGQAGAVSSIIDMANGNRNASTEERGRIQDLAKTLLLDEKNNAIIKDTNPGAYNAVSDIAKSNLASDGDVGFDKFNTNLDDYYTQGHQDFSVSTLRNAGKGFWDNWSKVTTSYLGGVDKNGNKINATKDVKNMSEQQKTNVVEMAKTITAAMQDSKFAGHLEPKYFDQMNEVRRLAHEIQSDGSTFKKIDPRSIDIDHGDNKGNRGNKGNKGNGGGRRRKR